MRPSLSITTASVLVLPESMPAAKRISFFSSVTRLSPPLCCAFSVSAKASSRVFSCPEDCGVVSVSILSSGISAASFSAAYSKL